ncbi:hypothetical protein PybrP1_012038 [[Pythium] brassicae (nom. inval.)]|nr:hypothetical protein PybrP1_012038 [[Pythium] brassicae (nom. inval.)]
MSFTSAVFTAFVRNSVLVAAFAVYVIDYPLALAFTAHTSLWTRITRPAVEIVFLIDFLFMFNTSFVDKRGGLVTSRLEIAKTYVRGWFVLDLLSSVPVHLIFAGIYAQANDSGSTSGSGGGELTPQQSGHALYDNVEFLFRVERLVHVLKVAHFFWFARLDRSGKGVLTWLLYSRYSHLFRIFWIVLFIALVAHYVAFERVVGERLAAAGEAVPMFDASSKIAPSTSPKRSSLRGDLLDLARHRQVQWQQDAGSAHNLYQVPDCLSGSRDDQDDDDDLESAEHPEHQPRLKAAIVPEPTTTQFHHLGKGQAFGEMALLMNYQRTANARAVSHVELCALSRDAFQQILVKHPEDRKKVMTSMLGTCMVHNEENAVYCPLKETVQSVYGGGSKGDPDSERAALNDDGRMRAEAAAALIMDVINPEQGDKSIRFGVNAGLRQQLVDKRDRDRGAVAPRKDTIDSKKEAAPGNGHEQLAALESQVRGLHDSHVQLREMLLDVREVIGQVQAHVRDLARVVASSGGGGGGGGDDDGSRVEREPVAAVKRDRSAGGGRRSGARSASVGAVPPAHTLIDKRSGRPLVSKSRSDTLAALLARRKSLASVVVAPRKQWSSLRRLRSFIPFSPAPELAAASPSQTPLTDQLFQPRASLQADGARGGAAADAATAPSAAGSAQAANAPSLPPIQRPRHVSGSPSAQAMPT